MHTLVISTGSNLGDRQDNLETASLLLQERIGTLRRSSAIYESVPWGYDSPNSYFNQCLLLDVDLSPEDCLGIMLGIEQLMGRTRRNKEYLDRIIDIDILFYDDLVLDSPSLRIPHLKIPDRRFVLLPLVEILPDLEHPVLKKSARELLDLCSDPLEVIPVIPA